MISLQIEKEFCLYCRSSEACNCQKVMAIVIKKLTAVELSIYQDRNPFNQINLMESNRILIISLLHRIYSKNIQFSSNTDLHNPCATICFCDCENDEERELCDYNCCLYDL